MYYCPKCLNPLEEERGCGSVSYFCKTCKSVISRQKMLNEEQRDEANKNKDSISEERKQGGFYI